MSGIYNDHALSSAKPANDAAEHKLERISLYKTPDTWSNLSSSPTSPRYHINTHVMGRNLCTFDSTKQLVTAVFDALKSHLHASSITQDLRRDISVGNILLTKEGRGLLVDWSLTGDANRSYTWEFASANLLMCPGKPPTLADDLEAFLHVLGWTMLRYLPASPAYHAEDRRRDLFTFDERSMQHGINYGGMRKRDSLSEGGWYPSFRFQPHQATPLFDLVKELRKPFESVYARAPTAEERIKVSGPVDPSDKPLCRLRAAVEKYDRNMRCLVSPAWFVDTISKALEEGTWPTNDKAHPNLPTNSFVDKGLAAGFRG